MVAQKEGLQTVNSKNPLASRTVQLQIVALVATAVGHWSPVVGSFIRDNALELLTFLPTATMLARSIGGGKLDWSFGLSKKF